MTGAGISADSGVQTFRDAGGLWEGHRPEDVATPEAWAANPALVWRFYQARRAQLAEVRPNPAHVALAEAAERCAARGDRLTLVTQNVDDLHERAGTRTLLHVHGELAMLACESCGERVRDLERVDPERFVPCAACGHERLRPDVVWFGEVPYHLDEIDALVVEVEVPVNTRAELRLPASDAGTVTESGRPATESDGVRLLPAREDQSARFELSSGRYRFHTTR